MYTFNNIAVYILIFATTFVVQRKFREVFPFKIRLISYFLLISTLIGIIGFLYIAILKTSVWTPGGFVAPKLLDYDDYIIALRLYIVLILIVIVAFILETILYYIIGLFLMYISRKSIERERDGKKGFLGIDSGEWKKYAEGCIKIRK